MTDVISYSLWGDLPKYWQGAKMNVELARKFFPGWTSRFYVDEKLSTTAEEFLEELKNMRSEFPVEIIRVRSKGPFHGMFWRFLAADDINVNIMLSRDTDSRLSLREALAVQQWLGSDKDFHIIRDHPYHEIPIMGGLWGCRNGILKNIGLDQRINNWAKYNAKGTDQDFLAGEIYPMVSSSAFEHSSFGIQFGNEVHELPGDRVGLEFVGDVFDENNVRHPSFWTMITQA